MEGLVQEGKRRLNFFRFCDDFEPNMKSCLVFKGKGQKDLELNGKKSPNLEIILVFFPSVTLSSRDFRLVREGPSDRRNGWICYSPPRLRNI